MICFRKLSIVMSLASIGMGLPVYGMQRGSPGSHKEVTGQDFTAVCTLAQLRSKKMNVTPTTATATATTAAIAILDAGDENAPVRILYRHSDDDVYVSSEAEDSEESAEDTESDEQEDVQLGKRTRSNVVIREVQVPLTTHEVVAVHENESFAEMPVRAKNVYPHFDKTDKNRYVCKRCNASLFITDVHHRVRKLASHLRLHCCLKGASTETTTTTSTTTKVSKQ